MTLKKYSAVLLLLGLSACNFPTRQALNEATLAVSILQTQVGQSPAQTMTVAALQTLAANPQQNPPSTANNSPPVHQVPTGKVVPQPAIPGGAVTPAAGVTVTGQAAVTVRVATNCRTGPGRSYAQVGVLNPGDRAVVVGKNEALDYWIIQNPDGAGTCWLWGYYATVHGNAALIPEVPNPDP